MAVPQHRYTALARFLDAEPRSAVRLSFATVEHVLGAPLPPSARNHRAWWGNETAARHVQAKAWMAVGWRVSAVNLTAEQVTFVRA